MDEHNESKQLIKVLDHYRKNLVVSSYDPNKDEYETHKPTIKEFCRIIDISPSFWYKLERGECSISLQKMFNIFYSLGIVCSFKIECNHRNIFHIMPYYDFTLR